MLKVTRVKIMLVSASCNLLSQSSNEQNTYFALPDINSNDVIIITIASWSSKSLQETWENCDII